MTNKITDDVSQVIIQNPFDKEYLRVCNNVMEHGKWSLNERTGKKTLKTHGEMMKFDLSSGKIPLLTLRKMFTDGGIAELLGFIRGYDNAADFRALGCNLWNENANESEHWLSNINRKGEDDLGNIYGVQARRWETIDGKKVDQLQSTIDKINAGNDDRGLIITHWNAGELDKMALRPCHLLYQFGLEGDTLNLGMYQRSADVPLGVPTNILSYALLLHLVARITNKKVGTFTHFLWDVHIYEDQYEKMKELIARTSTEAPTLWINPKIKTLEDLETWVTINDIKFIDYNPQPPIKFPFSK